MESSILSRNTKIGLLVSAVVLAVLYLLSEVVIPVAFSFLLAYFLDPVVDRFEEKKISRTLAIVFLLVLFLFAMFLFLLIFVPMIEQQISQFVKRLPELIHHLAERLVPFIGRWVDLEPETIRTEVDGRVTYWLQNMTADQLAPLTGFLSQTFSGTYSAIMAIVSAAIIPVFTFYFLRDFDTLKMKPLNLVPPRNREQILDLFRDIDEVLSSFIRGQVTVCAILAILYALGYSLSDVPLGFLIGIIAGILAFMPYLGAGIGLVLSVLMILLDWHGWGPLIGCGLTFSIVASLESYVLTPLIVGDKVGLSPVAVIIALMVGANLFGFAGILVAVPVTAVLNILFKRLVHSYRNTEFYKGEADG